jgi:hypothetical protein
MENGITGSIANCHDPVDESKLPQTVGRKLEPTPKYGNRCSEKGSQPDSPTNAPAAVAAFVKNVGAREKLGNTGPRAIAPTCQIGTT